MTRQILLGFLLYLLLGVTALLYHPGLSGPLLFDDFENLKPLADFSQGITTWRDVLTTNASGPVGRPISMLSFIANQWASAGDVWAYKYTNLMIHLLCGVLIFWLCGRLLQEYPLKSYCWAVALWVTAFWLLTPLQVSTVLYIVQRMAQLSTLFVLAGLVTYVIGRQNLECHPTLGITLILSCYFFWLPLAILSKENGVLLLLLVFVIEIFFFRFRAHLAGQRFLTILYILTLLLPALVVVIKLVLDPGFILNGYGGRDFTLGERLLTQARILFNYIWTLLIPYGPGLGLYHDDYIKSTTLLTPLTTLLSVSAWTLLIIIAALSLKAQEGTFKNASYIFFGIVFFLTAHFLESSIFPLELYFEHRNYLPAVGIYLAFGIALFSLTQKFKKQKLLIFLFAFIPVFHAIASYPRILNWTSFDQILFSSVQAHPQSARLHSDMSIYYYTHANPEKALFHLDEAKKWDPRLTSATAVMRIAVHCNSDLTIPDNEYEQLKQQLSFTRTISTKSAFEILATLLQHKPCSQLDIEKFGGIVEEWLKDLSAEPYSDTVWFVRLQLGRIFFYRGKIAQAINQMDKAIAIDPERLEPGLIKFQYQLALDDIDGAQKTLMELKHRDTGERVDLSQAIRDFDNYLKNSIK
ncbi:MAG: hypothetical protein WBE39_07720 [Candidatus Competibacter sp.]